MKQDNKLGRVDRGWDKMTVSLDQKMPQKKDRKRRFLFWLFFGGFILLAGISIYIHTSQTNHAQEVVEKQNPIVLNSNQEDKHSNESNLNSSDNSTTTDIINSEGGVINESSIITNNNESEKQNTDEPNISTSLVELSEKSSSIKKVINQDQIVIENTKALNYDKYSDLSTKAIIIVDNAEVTESLLNKDDLIVDSSVDPDSLIESHSTDIPPAHRFEAILSLAQIKSNISLLETSFIRSLVNKPSFSYPIEVSKKPKLKTQFGIAGSGLYAPNLRMKGLSARIQTDITQAKFNAGLFAGFGILNKKASTIDTLFSPTEQEDMLGALQDTSIYTSAKYSKVNLKNLVYLDFGMQFKYKFNPHLNVFSSLGIEYYFNSTFADEDSNNLANVSSGFQYPPTKIDNQIIPFLELGFGLQISRQLSLNAIYNNSFRPIIDDEESYYPHKISLGIKFNF